MNRGDNIKTQKIIGDDTELIKTIYIVRCKEIHNMPEVRITKNYNYNLFAFEDFNKAMEHVDTAYKTIINPLIKSEKFRLLTDNTEEDTVQSESDYNKILYKRNIKLIGDEDSDENKTRLIKKSSNKSQTKLFIITIETINFKPMWKPIKIRRGNPPPN